MFSEMVNEIKQSLRMMLVISVLTGIIYPVVVTIVAQLFFPHKANGSLIIKDDKVLGSELLGQNFSSAKYFSGRPSATTPAYNPLHSTGSNFGPINPEYIKAIKQRVEITKAKNPNAKFNIPVDLITASASGLDPHISRRAAAYQIPRIAQARGIKEEKIFALLEHFKQKVYWFNDGTQYVNVLKLNLALDELK